MRNFDPAKLIVLILLVSWSSCAEVILRERFEHYAIAPESIQQIKLELRKHSPVNREQQLFHGGTEWKLVPRFQVKLANNVCYIHDVRVSLDGIYTLPKMINKSTAPTSTQDQFEHYYQSLMGHEKGHQALWLQAGEEIELMLKNLVPTRSCGELKHQAKQKVGSIVLKYQQRNRQYDVETGHGKTQGVFIDDPLQQIEN